MNLETVLRALRALPAATAAIAEFRALIAEIATMLNEDDQAVLKAALDDLAADNDEGFARLDAKLAAIAAVKPD